MLLLAGATAPAQEGDDAPRPSGLALRSIPAAASVFLDGRYAGETASDGRLRIRTSAGTHQLRVSRRGHLDLVATLRLRPGREHLLRAELGRRGTAASQLPGPVAIDVGQVVRGAVAAGETHLYTFPGRPKLRRHLVVHVAESGTEAPAFAILDPTGAEVALTTLGPVPGNPPESARRLWSLDRRGPWTLRVTGRGGPEPAFYALSLEKALPPTYTGPDGPKRPRLEPGRPDPEDR